MRINKQCIHIQKIFIIVPFLLLEPMIIWLLKTQGMTTLSSNIWIMVFHNKNPRETFEEWPQMKATWSMPYILFSDICSLKVSRKIQLYWELIITLLGSSSMINLWSFIKRRNLDPNFKYIMLKSLRQQLNVDVILPNLLKHFSCPQTKNNLCIN